jgi:hypothetical protein
MSRSVSTHLYAIQTVFLHLEEDQDQDFEWEDFIEDVKTQITEKFPKFQSCDRWKNREDHIIIESGVAEVSVSAYNGIVAVCLAPLDPGNGLHVTWCRNAKFSEHLNAALKYCALSSMGTFSNGEQAFRPINNLQGLVTSKEGALW